MSSPVQTGLYIKMKVCDSMEVQLSVHINRLCLQVVCRPCIVGSDYSNTARLFPGMPYGPDSSSLAFQNPICIFHLDTLQRSRQNMLWHRPIRGQGASWRSLATEERTAALESHQHSYPLKFSHLVLSVLAKTGRLPPHSLAW